jgi:pimeloyl-ACP methyl ester carboxylesterase
MEQKVILILPGWRSKLENYRETLSYLTDYKTILLELPGFRTKLPQPWTYEDYVNFLFNFIKKAGLKKFILLGHSFGGAVTLLFSLKYPEMVEKLIIYNGAIVRKKSLKTRILNFLSNKFNFILKIFPQKIRERLKYFFYRYVIRSLDYYLVDEVMKETFKNIQKDLSKEFLEVKVPLYLIWGKKDKITPFSQIKNLVEIKKAKVYLLDGGHSLHFEKPKEFAQVIKEIVAD